MSSLISSGLGFGQQNASNPGVDYGGMSGILQKLDPIGNKITEIGGDPLNIYGHKNNPNALLFPGGQNPNANGVPSILPNLGPQSMIPQSPQGGFMPLGQTNPMGGNGGGIFNQMAANSAGQLFSPGYQTSSPKGAMPNQGSYHTDPIANYRGQISTPAQIAAQLAQGSMNSPPSGQFLNSQFARNLTPGFNSAQRGYQQK